MKNFTKLALFAVVASISSPALSAESEQTRAQAHADRMERDLIALVRENYERSVINPELAKLPEGFIWDQPGKFCKLSDLDEKKKCSEKNILYLHSLLRKK